MDTLDITDFFRAENAGDFSASSYELGEQAGVITWNNAKTAALDYAAQWITDESREEIADFVRYFGSLSADAIAAWSDTQLCAFLIQFISGDIREFQGLAREEWSEYEEFQQAGLVSSRLFRGNDGRIYYFIGD